MSDVTPKRAIGRPTKFRPEMTEQVAKLCRLGATDVQIADFFGVTEKTVNNWKDAHPAFFQSLKGGKTEADERVERGLFERATGYEHPAVKVFMPSGATKPVYAPITERYPPDTTAAIFWLKNRQPERWRDRQELTGPDGQPLVPVPVQIIAVFEDRG